jgi:hypothetical protein
MHARSFLVVFALPILWWVACLLHTLTRYHSFLRTRSGSCSKLWRRITARWRASLPTARRSWYGASTRLPRLKFRGITEGRMDSYRRDRIRWRNGVHCTCKQGHTGKVLIFLLAAATKKKFWFFYRGWINLYLPRKYHHNVHLLLQFFSFQNVIYV